MEQETYCGKSCTECPHREELDCPGCKSGPGVAFGSCAIARCCREKNHADCKTCTSWVGCGLRAGREQEPVIRKKSSEWEAQKKQELQAKAPVLVRWISVLFWLFIPQIIANLMTDDNVTKVAPALWMPGVLLTMACTLIYGAALWKMQSIDRGYRTAAICNFVVGLGNLVNFVTSNAYLQVFIALGLLALSLASCYVEYNTHAEVLVPTNMPLAQQWRQLWKWNLWCIGGLVLVFVLVLLAPILALLLTLAVAIAVIVLQVLKLVYLRRMANHFRQYC